MIKDYTIGLDIGTGSVGWAVINNETNNIVVKKKKALWGVRLFETAETAEQRRLFRNSRRRYNRRRYRIKLLQKEFETEMNKVDSNFYTKLKEFFYQNNDKVNKTIKLTKQDKKFFKEYSNKYPTIYHLRNKLIINPEKEDLRLVYLAIHHIIKYRGNFLQEGEDFKVDNIDVKNSLNKLFNSISQFYEIEGIDENFNDIINLNELEKALLENKKTDRKEKIKEVLSVLNNKEFTDEFTKAINKNKFKFNKMIKEEINEDNKIELSFQTNEYDDNFANYEKILEDKIEVLVNLKDLYDTVYLKLILKNETDPSISKLKIRKYNQHKEDLRYLKDLFKNNEEIYYGMFKGKDCLYEKYNHNNLTYEEFVKGLKKYLEKIFETELNQELIDKYTVGIKQRIENDEFLPRVSDKNNGMFPYQLNKYELIKIIENQGKYYPFLLDKYNEDTYKVVRLLEFRIPYYIGPLTSEQKSNFAWMIRKTDEKITPFNFNNVVDTHASAEKFILRMIKKCTYLINEDSMPTNSILYSKFKVMNELKQIKIDGTRLSNDTQQFIIENLFKKEGKTITDSIFRKFLSFEIKDILVDDNSVIKGYSDNKKFANNMKSYYDFFGENGIFENTNLKEEDAEEIIKWITIFEDKKLLIEKVKENYPQLSEEKLKQIKSKRYKGWSSLSKRLLTEKHYMDPKTNTKKSIFDIMEETKKNFMQIISDKKYNFEKMINDINNPKKLKLSYELVENLAGSPAIKRGIYQSLKIVDEIIKIMKSTPSHISIEMAREEGKKERTNDRKEIIKKLYDEIIKDSKEDYKEYKKLKKELNNLDKIDNNKYYLYFLQQGKCLYSGRKIEIDELLTDKYEIDHILPRTLIKDNSLDNLALVYREENQNKGGQLVLPQEIRKKMKTFWYILNNQRLLSNRKYNNLIREKFSDEDIEGFINRQIVETRQITKHVGNILENLYNEDDNKINIIYLKANLSHNYREKYKIYKFREINDYHHAHDAYLAAVLGVHKEKLKEIKPNKLEEINKNLYRNKKYQSLTHGYVLNSLDPEFLEGLDIETGEIFKEEASEKLEKIIKLTSLIERNLYRNDILISKKTEFKTGELFNQTISSKSGKVPLKKGLDVNKYGGYTSINPSYGLMVKYKNKQKLIGIPIYIENTKSKEKLGIYIRKLLKLKENESYEIISSNIPLSSYILYEKHPFFIVGLGSRTELKSAKQLHINKNDMKDFSDSLNILLNKNKYNFENEDLYKKYLNDLDNIIKYLINKIIKEYLFYGKSLEQIKIFENNSSYSKEEKEDIIKELLKITKVQGKVLNLKKFGLSDRWARTDGKTISNMKLINKSVTGFWEKEDEF